MKTHLAFVVGSILLATQAYGQVPFEVWGGSVVDWSRVVERSEAQLRTAGARGCIETAEREATISQIRAGATSLRALLVATSAADSLLAGNLITTPPPFPRQGQWGNRFLRTTNLVALSTGLVNMAEGMREYPDNELRQTLGNVAGAVGGAGALFGMLRPRPKSPPWVDPVERARTLTREMLLRDTFEETERRLQELAEELGAIQADPATTDSAAVNLVHRYAGAIDLAGALYDLQVPHSMMVARSGAAYPNFNEAGRARLARLSDHLESVGAEWREWRWLIGRSQRSALGFLALVEQR